MPQLDLLTFFTQFFWAVLCLFIFYFFVSKLILPELTRVLKYRSKASAFSTSGETLNALPQQSGQETSNQVSHPSSSGRSGSSALYQYACSSSSRVLMEAQQRRDTFLNKVISKKGESEKGFTSQATEGEDQKQDSSSLHSENFKSSSKNSKTSKNKNPKNPKE